MFRVIHKLKAGVVESVVAHLDQQRHKLTSDTSSYATGRLRYWLQAEWDLRERTFRPATHDSRLWKLCRRVMPDADLGLVVYGPVGIKLHRDDSYADWRGVGINLGTLDGWVYDCQYPEFRWTTQQNDPNPVVHNVSAGDVFEFNTKNPHAALNPAENRWAVFLWRVSPKYKTLFNQTTKRGE